MLVNDEIEKELILDEDEYRELAKVKEGTTGKLTATWRKEETENGRIHLILESCEVETKNKADKDYDEMSKREDRVQELDDDDEDGF